MEEKKEMSLKEKIKRIKGGDKTVKLTESEARVVLATCEEMGMASEGDAEYSYERGDYGWGDSLADDYGIYEAEINQYYRIARIAEDQYVVSMSFTAETDGRGSEKRSYENHVMCHMDDVDAQGLTNECYPFYIDSEDAGFSESFLKQLPIVDVEKLLEEEPQNRDTSKSLRPITLSDLLQISQEELENLVAENEECIDFNQRSINREKLRLIEKIKQQQTTIEQQRIEMNEIVGKEEKV